MKNELSDEQFDKLLRQAMYDAALDDDAIADIADSPTLWWGIQRRINEQKGAKSPWPPVYAWKRWLMVSVPATAALAIALLFFSYHGPVSDTQVISAVEPQSNSKFPAEVQPLVEITPPIVDPIVPVTSATTVNRVIRKLTAAGAVRRTAKPNTATMASKHSEIKTDFIALTYARDPDSGQIVRVKVPSSMLVTLGVVATVEKPTDMVDAEVLVGDDGLTRAIRFIR